MSLRKAPLALAALVLAGLTLTGCSSKAVAESDVEEQAAAALEESVGQRPDEVDCPGDLDAEEGTEMRCTLSAGGQEIGMTLTVTSVDGDNVKFDVQVDDQVAE